MRAYFTNTDFTDLIDVIFNISDVIITGDAFQRCVLQKQADILGLWWIKCDTTALQCMFTQLLCVNVGSLHSQFLVLLLLHSISEAHTALCNPHHLLYTYCKVSFTDLINNTLR